MKKFMKCLVLLSLFLLGMVAHSAELKDTVTGFGSWELGSSFEPFTREFGKPQLGENSSFYSAERNEPLLLTFNNHTVQFEVSLGLLKYGDSFIIHEIYIVSQNLDSLDPETSWGTVKPEKQTEFVTSLRSSFLSTYDFPAFERKSFQDRIDPSRASWLLSGVDKTGNSVSAMWRLDDLMIIYQDSTSRDERDSELNPDRTKL